ncbi:MAG: hypothetical protein D6730_07550 [Bacteroidetes bacterium]|nr:MAG: hypothetical protein D6730_07550 [Bacteroidota bacterium]
MLDATGNLETRTFVACFLLFSQQTKTGMINENRSASLYFNYYRYTLAAVVTMVVLIVAIGCHREVQVEHKGYTPTFSPYHVPPHYRGKQAEVQPDLLDSAMAAYSAAQYCQAASQFEQFLQKRPAHLMASFYAGVALLACHQPAKAYSHLYLAATDSFSDYQLPASWYLSLACLETQKYEQARSLLNQLREGESEYREQAVRILQNHPLMLSRLEDIPVYDAMADQWLPDSLYQQIMESGIDLQSPPGSALIGIRFLKHFDAECILRLYNDEGLLVHLERVSSPDPDTQTRIDLSYKPRGEYRLLIQVGKGHILPFRIRV